MLIGLDCANLHRSILEKQEGPMEPTACLTPLGWTCAGQIQPENNRMCSNLFVDLHSAVKGFSEMDAYPTNTDLKVLQNTEKNNEVL